MLLRCEKMSDLFCELRQKLVRKKRGKIFLKKIPVW